MAELRPVAPETLNVGAQAARPRPYYDGVEVLASVFLCFISGRPTCPWIRDHLLVLRRTKQLNEVTTTKLRHVKSAVRL